MSCTKIKDEIVCIGDDSFHCPHCGKVYNDEKYCDRINKNKSGYTRIYCSCGKPFNLFVDTFGIYHGVMTFKQMMEKYRQKQALIDTMRGDEEIGLYDDNPKITDMNEVEFLATKLACPDLINANRNQLNSAVRQAISYYLKKAGYHERDIAKMQRKSRATIYYHIKTFRELLQVRDPLAIMLWKKLGI